MPVTVSSSSEDRAAAQPDPAPSRPQPRIALLPTGWARFDNARRIPLGA